MFAIAWSNALATASPSASARVWRRRVTLAVLVVLSATVIEPP
jgi:hypothetical protein